MDHFNITIQNGELVSTRRGLRVTKQKHNGTSFVNLSVQGLQSKSAPPVDFSRPMQKRFKFVNDEPASSCGASTSKFRVKDNEAQQSHGRPPKKSVAEKEDDCSQSISSVSTATSHSEPSSAATTWLPKGASRLSPSKPSSVTSDPFHGADIPGISITGFYENTPGSILPSLPTWTTHNLPVYLTDENKKLFHSYFDLIPKKMYPFEDILSYNPTRSRDFYSLVIADMAALHCVLMCGSVFDSITRGTWDSKELAWHVSKVCSIINHKLDKDSGQIESITLECITTLALMGNTIGRYDHWNVHMKGLKQMIEMGGGMANLRPSLLTKIRRTDVKGASSLGTLPHLPFQHFFSPISDVLPPAIRSSITASMTSILSAYNIDPAVVDTLANLSRFVHAFALARSSRSPASPAGTAVTYDPNAFTEELHWIQYRLVSLPGPLRTGRTDDASRTSRPTTPNPLGAAVVVAADTDARDVHPAPADNPLEPALRIAAILYLKELVPDFPRNVGGYAVLLALLVHHVRTATAAYVVLRDGEMAAAGAGADAEGCIEPLLPRGGGWGAEGRLPPSLRSSSWRAMRPALLWVAVIGSLSSVLADANECRYGASRYDRGVFAACLAEVLCGGETVHSVEDVDDVVRRNLDEMHDLVLCRLVSLRHVRGERWDDREALRWMLLGREYC